MEFYCIATIVEGGGTGGYLRGGGSGKAGESKKADARLGNASFHGTLQADSDKIYITGIPRGHRPRSYATGITNFPKTLNLIDLPESNKAGEPACLLGC